MKEPWKVLKEIDNDDIVEYVTDVLNKQVYNDDSDVLDYVKDGLDKKLFDDDDEIIYYVEDSMHKMVVDIDDYRGESSDDIHPRNYIDSKDSLREHLISILGLGHYMSDDDIIDKVKEIFKY